MQSGRDKQALQFNFNSINMKLFLEWILLITATNLPCLPSANTSESVGSPIAQTRKERVRSTPWQCTVQRTVTHITKGKAKEGTGLRTLALRFLLYSLQCFNGEGNRPDSSCFLRTETIPPSIHDCRVHRAMLSLQQFPAPPAVQKNRQIQPRSYADRL